MKCARVIVGAGLMLVSMLPVDRAAAGPWTREPGETFSLVSLRYLTNEFSTDDADAYRQPTASIYAEHGIREAITIGVEAEGSLGLKSDGSMGNAGLARAFARARLWTGEKGEIISFEASLGTQAELDSAPFVQPRMSFLYGEGYEDGWYDLAASVRFRGTKADELHSVATYGYLPAEGWMTYFQATTIQRLEPGPDEDFSTSSFGLFVGYDVAPARTVVLGVRRDFFTTVAPPALEASISFWARF